MEFGDVVVALEAGLGTEVVVAVADDVATSVANVDESVSAPLLLAGASAIATWHPISEARRHGAGLYNAFQRWKARHPLAHRLLVRMPQGMITVTLFYVDLALDVLLAHEMIRTENYTLGYLTVTFITLQYVVVFLGMLRYLYSVYTLDSNFFWCSALHGVAVVVVLTAVQAAVTTLGWTNALLVGTTVGVAGYVGVRYNGNWLRFLAGPASLVATFLWRDLSGSEGTVLELEDIFLHCQHGLSRADRLQFYADQQHATTLPDYETYRKFGLDLQQKSMAQMKQAYGSLEAHRQRNLAIGKKVKEVVGSWRDASRAVRSKRTPPAPNKIFSMFVDLDGTVRGPNADELRRMDKRNAWKFHGDGALWLRQSGGKAAKDVHIAKPLNLRETLAAVEEQGKVQKKELLDKAFKWSEEWREITKKRHAERTSPEFVLHARQAEEEQRYMALRAANESANAVRYWYLRAFFCLCLGAFTLVTRDWIAVALLIAAFVLAYLASWLLYHDLGGFFRGQSRQREEEEEKEEEEQVLKYRMDKESANLQWLALERLLVHVLSFLHWARHGVWAVSRFEPNCFSDLKDLKRNHQLADELETQAGSLVTELRRFLFVPCRYIIIALVLAACAHVVLQQSFPTPRWVYPFLLFVLPPLLMDVVMIVDPLTLIDYMPEDEKEYPVLAELKRFIPAYRATRSVVEVFLEAVPQSLLQTYIYVLVVVLHAEAGGIEINTKLLVQSLSLSLMNLSMKVLEIRSAMRAANIDFQTHMAQQLAMGAGIPLDALKHDTLLDLSLNAKTFDESSTRQVIAALRANNSVRTVRIQSPSAALMDLLSEALLGEAVLPNLQTVGFSSKGSWVIPAAPFRAGGDEIRTFLNSIKYGDGEDAPSRDDLNCLYGLLQTKAEAERTQADAENSSAAVTALLEQAKLIRGQKKETKDDAEWIARFTELLHGGMLTKQELQDLINHVGYVSNVEVRCCVLHPPAAAYAKSRVVAKLETRDKHNLKLRQGGYRVDARALGPNAGICTVNDESNGEYSVEFEVNAPGDYKVQVRIDAVELKPLTISVTKKPEDGNERK